MDTKIMKSYYALAVAITTNATVETAIKQIQKNPKIFKYRFITREPLTPVVHK